MSLELGSQHHDWLLLLLLKMHRNSRHRFLEWFAWTFVHVAIYLCTPTVGSWQRQWVIKAAHHCYSQWRWWSDTLWATLIRLWLYSLPCCLPFLCCGELCAISDICVLPQGHIKLYLWTENNIGCFFLIFHCHQKVYFI